jgi:hypothetical protein
MKRYSVKVKESYWVKVDANSKDEAKQFIREGIPKHNHAGIYQSNYWRGYEWGSVKDIDDDGCEIRVDRPREVYLPTRCELVEDYNRALDKADYYLTRYERTGEGYARRSYNFWISKADRIEEMLK